MWRKSLLEASMQGVTSTVISKWIRGDVTGPTTECEEEPTPETELVVLESLESVETKPGGVDLSLQSRVGLDTPKTGCIRIQEVIAGGASHNIIVEEVVRELDLRNSLFELRNCLGDKRLRVPPKYAKVWFFPWLTWPLLTTFCLCHCVMPMSSSIFNG